jgi:hypothetical protein
MTAVSMLLAVAVSYPTEKMHELEQFYMTTVADPTNCWILVPLAILILVIVNVT